MTVQLKISGDNKEALKALEQAQRQLAKLTGETEKLRSQNKRLRGTTTGAFADIKKSILGAVSGMGGLRIATDQVKAAMRFMREESDKALASLQEQANTRRLLLGVSGGDPRRLRQLEARATRLASETGVSRDVVRQVLFQGISEGFEGFVPEIIRGRQVIDPLVQAQLAGQVPALFGGRLSPRESRALAFRAAESSRISPELFGPEVPTAAAGATGTGTSPEETFALLGVLAKRFRSPRTAGERIKTLGVKLGLSEQFGGRGILGGIDALLAAPEEERRKFLGESIELNTAFNTIREERATVELEIGKLRRERALVGVGGTLFAQSLAIAQADPTRRAEAQVAIAEQRREIANERENAIRRAGERAAGEDIQTRLLEQGATGAQRFFARQATDVVDLVGGGREAITAAGLATAEFGEGGGAFFTMVRLLNEAVGELRAIRGNQRTGVNPDAHN